MRIHTLHLSTISTIWRTHCLIWRYNRSFDAEHPIACVLRIDYKHYKCEKRLRNGNKCVESTNNTIIKLKSSSQYRIEWMVLNGLEWQRGKIDNQQSTRKIDIISSLSAFDRNFFFVVTFTAIKINKILFLDQPLRMSVNLVFPQKKNNHIPAKAKAHSSI